MRAFSPDPNILVLCSESPEIIPGCFGSTPSLAVEGKEEIGSEDDICFPAFLGEAEVASEEGAQDIATGKGKFLFLPVISTHPSL